MSISATLSMLPCGLSSKACTETYTQRRDAEDAEDAEELLLLVLHMQMLGSSPFKGEARRGMGYARAETHPHPSPPLEGEGPLSQCASGEKRWGEGALRQVATSAAEL
jgi:hypothetical protein